MRVCAHFPYRIAALLVLGAGVARAQGSGQGEIALQGYYLGGDVPKLSNVTGIASTFRTFFPGFGVLSGSLENYGSDGRFRTGDNFLDLNGVPWGGLRWRFTGGDFRVSTALIPSPFTNIILPELGAEGGKIEASSANRRYSVFYGVETLLAGPRVPFRFRVPQNVLGASLTRRIAEKLDVGVRFLNLSTSPNSTGTTLFAPGQDFRMASTISTTVSYNPTANLQFYAEASAAATSGSSIVSPAHQSPFSFTAGPVWNSRKLTVKANYVHQPSSYLPIAGYLLGDRSGPFVEARVRPIESIELFGSSSAYRNNLGNSPDLPTFHSTATSAGVSISLPYRFSTSGQLSTIDLSIQQPGVDSIVKSHNRQLSGTLGRPIGKHNIHASYRDLDLRSDGRRERQRSLELEDVFQFKRMSLGAAVRDQRLIAELSKDTIFVRGSAQMQFGRLSAYAYIEHGNDLANRTVFLTDTFNTTVLGGALRLSKAWNLRVEASRNQLTSELNPENTFLLQNQGTVVTNAILGLNQWTAYFRLSKSFRWGGDVPSGDLDRYVEQQLPIVGIVAGTVLEEAAAGNYPARGIPVVLDEGRVETTDESGAFQFSRVPEGRHRVAIAVNQLPANYDPGTVRDATLEVRPRHTTTAALHVVPLLSIAGRIAGPAKTSLDGIIVRLLPADRYTTPDAGGRFAFYNLREGEYDLAIDAKSLPEFAVIDRLMAHVSLKREAPAEEPAFQLEIKTPQKPIRRAGAHD